MRIFFLLAAGLLPFLLAGQDRPGRISARVTIGDTSQVHLLTLVDNSTFFGTVTAVTGDSVRLVSRSFADPLVVPWERVHRISRYRGGWGAPSAQLALDDLTLVRTALPFAGRRRFKTVMLMYNALDFNLNPHLQLGVGNAAVLGLTFSQRYRTSLSSWLHLGVSNETLVIPTLSLYSVGVGLAGDLTGLLTVGSSDQFVHFGTGLFYIAGEGPLANFRLGAGRRISPSVHLSGELLAVGTDAGQLAVLPSLTVGLARRSHRWGFGLATVMHDGETFFPPPIPYLSYAVYY
ncbi:hypothetical protein GGR26_000434 [Lewinella marina]|uniref:Uncharacterized protein n=1 Tax=Neolewinella marina TaxID=438751 RepID=A0A2G0CJJ6_9BACT|nr:hypothetical protein [Neolewinella marina]NJB84689.1 hypothetical protein [Neolewinella marina]PHL00142.1 hypothetical protein CGL56_03620 [Neolewinella marina]